MITWLSSAQLDINYYGSWPSSETHTQSLSSVSREPLHQSRLACSSHSTQYTARMRIIAALFTSSLSLSLSILNNSLNEVQAPKHCLNDGSSPFGYGNHLDKNHMGLLQPEWRVNEMVGAQHDSSNISLICAVILET